MVVGIDLGTTFSAIAHLNNSGNAEIIVNRDGERVTPSVVMFEGDNAVVGEQAKENSVLDPLEVCQFVKRQMGKRSFSFEPNDEDHYSAEDISAMILKRLTEDAQDRTGEMVEGAVITVPAYFDDAQRKATEDAGKIAGLNVLGIINEPTAAAIAYCHGLARNDGKVMVFDLGGGTFDITVMELSENLHSIDILATTGLRNMGGFDFDNEIILKVTKEFKEKYGEDIYDDDVASQDLRLKAENAKKALSSRQKTSISIVSNGHALRSDITREEFEQMIAHYLDSLSEYMEMAMEDANLSWRDLSKILLVGGSTRIPAVQSMIKELTGIEPSHELNPDEAVALGAAYYASSLSENVDDRLLEHVQITDVNSHSLGVIADDNRGDRRMVPIILKNSPLPITRVEEFYLTSDNQSMIKLEVLEGEDEDPQYDIMIGTSIIEFSPRNAGYPINIMMSYDKNGMIHISVQDGRTGEDLGEMSIERQSNLSEEEIYEKKNKINDLNVE